MNRSDSLPALSLSLLIAAAAVVGCGTDVEEPGAVGVWPQWRGAAGVGVSPVENLPKRWSADSKKIRWRTQLDGEGNSSPIVSGDRVFVTAARGRADNRQRLVYAIDLQSGEVIWEKVVIVAPKETRHYLNTFAAPTPVTDGETVFVHFGQHLAALSFDDGEILWTKEIDPDFVEYSLYGAGSSPVLAGDVILIAHDRETVEKPFGWIGGFAKSDGREIWRRTWDNTCCSYSTPLVRRRGDTLEAVFAKSGEVVGYAPATGERLWAYELPIIQPVPTPVADGDLLAVFGGGNRVRYGAMLRLTGEGAETTVESIWETDKIIPQTPSPVLYKGLLFTVSDTGTMVCYDAETGEIHWRQRIGRGTYGPSLVAGADRVYAATNEGITTVIAASPKFQVLARNDLGEGSNASSALTPECLVLRSQTAVLCIEPGRKPGEAAPREDGDDGKKDGKRKKGKRGKKRKGGKGGKGASDGGAATGNANGSATS